MKTAAAGVLLVLALALMSSNIPQEKPKRVEFQTLDPVSAREIPSELLQAETQEHPTGWIPVE